MKLALCIITKGDSELDSLKHLIETSKGVFSKVYITANHKHTKTKKWCKESGYNFSFLKWDNSFSEQRNFNFSQVSSDIDYIVWADCDDQIVGVEHLPSIARTAQRKGYDCVYFEYWYGCKFKGKPSLDTLDEVEIKHNRERLIRPGKMLWKKRIHENPEPIDDQTFKYSYVKHSEEYPVAWLHLSAERDGDEIRMSNRLERNRKMLELDLAEERAQGQPDPRTILYLMKILVESDNGDDIQECLRLGEEYMALSGWDQERAVCRELMAKCYGILGDDQTCIVYLFDAIREYPNNITLYLLLSQSYYNIAKYREMGHWLDMASKIELDGVTSAIVNLLEIKVLTAQLTLLYNLHAKKNIKKAYKASRELYKLIPSKENKDNVAYLKHQYELDKVCGGIHSYMQYLVDNQQEGLIEDVYKTMPSDMRRLPFALYYLNKYKQPRLWGGNTIVYYASFGGPHFERWDGRSLEKGIGGSETAVVRLSEEWKKKGYEVVVYCDCGDTIVHNGVAYVPYYYFNPKDYFNILILWRHSGLAGKVKARKLLVDLHDIFHESSHMNNIHAIDALMVKSNYHRELAPNIGSHKFKTISNGI